MTLVLQGPRVALLQAAEGQDKGWAEGVSRLGTGRARASLYLGLQEHREGQRTIKGAFSEGRRGGKDSSFPVGAKKLQEEGEDVDDV